MEERYKYTNEKLFETDPAVDKANEEYQEAIQRLLAKEITLEECRKYQQAVFDAVNKSTIGWTIRKEKASD